MKRYIYRVIEGPNDHYFEKFLLECGAGGWKLVQYTVAPSPHPESRLIYTAVMELEEGQS